MNYYNNKDVKIHPEGASSYHIEQERQRYHLLQGQMGSWQSANRNLGASLRAFWLHVSCCRLRNQWLSGEGPKSKHQTQAAKTEEVDDYLISWREWGAIREWNWMVMVAGWEPQHIMGQQMAYVFNYGESGLLHC